MSSNPQVQRFQESLGFPMDPFQVDACEAVARGTGVLVCAPTGAGKTLVGEFAVLLALERGMKCYYTTPIKALSNQKYHDLVEAHGEDAVGLLTGDRSINGHAQIVVMTTEVLRNMIYADSPDLVGLSHVVMDEVHYLADRSRGAVWEEVILNLDAGVSVIGLSATVSNSEEFGEWLGTVRGETEGIVAEHRPVPLHQHMLVGARMFPLLGRDGDVDRQLERAAERAHPKPLGRPEVLRILEGRGMLPAITFIFSRAGCDSALFQCLRSRLTLTTQEEARQIGEIVDRGVADIPAEDLEVLRFRQWKAALKRGFAAHHAGMLPAFRHIVEELFTAGLVRAVFATETLALGINMPARTVVLERLVKFNGEAHVELTPGEYTQLTGRAGRRGIDTEGHAVVLWGQAMDPRGVAGLASTRTYPLISTFSPGYNMSVNLLRTLGYDPALRMIERSFAQYQADGSVVQETQAAEKAEQRASQLYEELQGALGERSTDEFLEYMRLRRSLTDAEKSAKRQGAAERFAETAAILRKLRPGDVIAMPTKKRPLVAAVTAPARDHHDPRPRVTTELGWQGRIGADDFANPPVALGTIRLPKTRKPGPVIAALRKVRRPKKLRLRARSGGSAEVNRLRAELRQHPAHHWEGRDRLTRVAERYLRKERDAHRMRGKISQATDTLGLRFDRILDLLTELDYVDETPAITDEGDRLAQIHAESDLLVAQCLRRGIWNELDPAELAGVVSMCVFENRKEVGGEPEPASERMGAAMRDTLRLWTELVADEERHHLPPTRMPEGGFALAVHQWAAGAPLEYAMAAAAASGAELTPGDFVRWCRQVVDLLEQVAATGYTPEIKRRAHQAVAAIRRGVVALGA